MLTTGGGYGMSRSIVKETYKMDGKEYGSRTTILMMMLMMGIDVWCFKEIFELVWVIWWEQMREANKLPTGNMLPGMH